MNTQYRKNLKAVLEASKSYCDESIESLKWELGTYDLSVETVNGTTMLLPTPTNTIQATMVRVDGKSEVCSNLFSFNNVSVGTDTSAVTFTINNDNSITITNTDSVESRIGFVFNYSGTISISFNSNSTSGIFRIVSLSISQRYVNGLNKIENINYNNNYISLYLDANETITISNFMINKGSTALPFEPYYTGIHNLELTGIRSEGANVFGSNDVATGTNVGVTSKVENNTIYLDGTSNAFGAFFAKTNLLTPIKAGTYSVRYFVKSGTGTNVWLDLFDANGNVVISKSITTSAETITLTKDIVAYRIFNWSGAVYTNFYFHFSFSRSAVGTYSDYVAPTTLPIDLSTILYNGSPLFANGLLGYGGITDSITPYKATKNKLFITLNKTDYTWTANSNNTLYYCDYNFGVKDEHITGTDDNDITNNILCDKLSACAANDLYNEVVTSGICINNASASNFYRKIGISASDYANLTTLNVVVDLANPIEVSIDFSQLVKFEAHSNGSITLVNTNNQDTTSTFKYLKEVAK